VFLRFVSFHFVSFHFVFYACSRVMSCRVMSNGVGEWPVDHAVVGRECRQSGTKIVDSPVCVVAVVLL
jgi:hypothetical protein